MWINPRMNGTDRHLVMEGRLSFQYKYPDVAGVVTQHEQGQLTKAYMAFRHLGGHL